MISINNKTIRWFLLSAFIIIPYIGLLTGVPFSRGDETTWVGFMIVIHACIVIFVLMIVVIIVVTGDLEINYTIKLWKPRERPPVNVNVRDMLIRYGQEPTTLDSGQPNPEHERLYNELKKLNVFG